MRIGKDVLTRCSLQFNVISEPLGCERLRFSLNERRCGIFRAESGTVDGTIVDGAYEMRKGRASPKGKDSWSRLWWFEEVC